MLNCSLSANGKTAHGNVFRLYSAGSYRSGGRLTIERALTGQDYMRPLLDIKHGVEVCYA